MKTKFSFRDRFNMWRAGDTKDVLWRKLQPAYSIPELQKMMEKAFTEMGTTDV